MYRQTRLYMCFTDTFFSQNYSLYIIINTFIDQENMNTTFKKTINACVIFDLNKKKKK
jgi:hypothetical protein